MLREGKNLELEKSQQVVLVAVGHEYKTWQGGINPATGGPQSPVLLCRPTGVTSFLLMHFLQQAGQSRCGCTVFCSSSWLGFLPQLIEMILKPYRLLVLHIAGDRCRV